MQAEVFLDSTYAIALAAVSNQHLALAEDLEKAGTRLGMTQAVHLEIG